MTASLFPEGAVDGRLPAGMLRHHENYATYVREDGVMCAIQVTLLFDQRFSGRIGLALRNVVAPSFSPRSEHVIDVTTLIRAFAAKTESYARYRSDAAYGDIQLATPDGDTIGFVKYPGDWLVQLGITDLPRGGTVLLNSSRLKKFIEDVEVAQLLGI